MTYKIINNGCVILNNNVFLPLGEWISGSVCMYLAQKLAEDYKHKEDVSISIYYTTR